MLKGEKVTLRAIEKEDLPRLHELHANVELEMEAGGDWYPESLASMEKAFENRLGDDESSRFVIVVDGKVIGGIGLHHNDRRSRVTSFGIAILDPDYLGKGYGREAICLMLDWAFRI